MALVTHDLQDPVAGPSLTDAELEAFERDGFAGPFTAFTPAEMEPIVARIEEARRRPSAPYGAAIDRDLHLTCRAVYELLSHPAVVGRIASCLGPDVLLWRSQFFHKRPGDREFLWHHGFDFPGHLKRPSLVPAKNVTCWFAITEATRANGCVKLLPGRHDERLPRVKVPKGQGIFGRGAMIPDLDEGSRVDMELAPGQFFLFSEGALHGSDPNTTSEPRIGISARYTPTSTRVYPGMWMDGKGLPLRYWHAIQVHGEDAFGHNKIGPPPQQDFVAPSLAWRLQVRLFRRWIRFRYGR